MEVDEAYKHFYLSESGKVILKDLCRYVEINKPVYSPGDNVTDAVYQSACHSVVHYIFTCCDTSLQKEIEENVGREQ